jgi:Uma2 family endonuclease
VGTRPATLDDLMRTEGKAELIAGRIVRFPPHGHFPATLSGRIRRSLFDYAEFIGRGQSLGGTVGFVFPTVASGRESFCADAAYYTGPLPADPMHFVPGPPDFAAEVRSENDYGPGAEIELAKKRADYFEAGPRVVWDVDPIARIVRRYRPGEATATEFPAGTEADAEPAVPGWRVAVDWLMRSP